MRWVTFEQSWRRDGRVGSSVHGPAPTGIRRYKRALKHRTSPSSPRSPNLCPNSKTTPDGTLVRSPPTIHKPWAHRLSDRIPRFFPRNLALNTARPCLLLERFDETSARATARQDLDHPATTDSQRGILSHTYEYYCYTCSIQGPFAS